MEVAGNSRGRSIGGLRITAFLFVVAALIWTWQWPTLSQPLVEAHPFRQTQTAYQTLSLVEGWGSLLHPRLPVLGAPWEVPYEFPLFQLTASWIIRVFNVTSDQGNRAAGLMWFTLCLLPLWKLARSRLDVLTSSTVIIFFAFSPFALQWSRTSMIDFCSVFFGLMCVVAFRQMWVSRSIRWAITTAVAGAMCGAVKATTLVAFLPLVVFLVPEFFQALRRPLEHSRLLLRSVGAWLVVAVATVAWTRHADAIKGAHPQTSNLTTSALREWNFGTLNQRRIWDAWDVILSRIDGTLTPKHAAVLLLLVPLATRDSRRLAWGALTSLVLGISLFFNLYVVHDYYLMAVAPQVAILLGIAVATIALRARTHRRPLITVLTVLIVLLASWIPSKPYWSMSRARFASPIDEITWLSSPDQYVFTGTNTWDPKTMYYARRRGFAVFPSLTPPSMLAELPDLQRYDFYSGPPTMPEIVKLRGFYAPVGDHTVRIDDNPADLTHYPVVFSSSPSVAEFSQRNMRGKTRSSRLVPCNGTATLNLLEAPMGSKIRTISTGENRIIVGTGRTPVPVGTYVVVHPGRPGRNDHTMKCEGDGWIEVRWWT